MSFIDWSDAEALLGLLVEFVADEENDSHADIKRQRFLADLLSQLTVVKEQFDSTRIDKTVAQLRDIYESVNQEFLQDPVLVHISACIEEVENISNGAA